MSDYGRNFSFKDWKLKLDTLGDLERAGLGGHSVPLVDHRVPGERLCIIVAGTTHQGETRRRWQVRENDDLKVVNAFHRARVISTSSKNAIDKLRGLSFRTDLSEGPLDIVDFYGTWDRQGGYLSVMSELRRSGFRGEERPWLSTRSLERGFEAAKLDILGLRRELGDAPTP